MSWNVCFLLLWVLPDMFCCILTTADDSCCTLSGLLLFSNQFCSMVTRSMNISGDSYFGTAVFSTKHCFICALAHVFHMTHLSSHTWTEWIVKESTGFLLSEVFQGLPVVNHVGRWIWHFPCGQLCVTCFWHTWLKLWRTYICISWTSFDLF